VFILLNVAGIIAFLIEIIRVILHPKEN